MNNPSVSRRSLIALASATASTAALGMMGAGSLGLSPKSANAATVQDLTARPCITVFDQATESSLREMGTSVDLASIAGGEYPSYCFVVQNNATDALDVWESYVTVDDSEPWGWTEHTIAAQGGTLYHVYYENMQRVLAEGNHTASLYINGELVCSATFTITCGQSWGDVFPFPSQEEIQQANQEARCQAPYIAGCLGLQDGQRYISYSIDFKADAAPAGTYCCLAQWAPDLTVLRYSYPDAHCDYASVGGYAGLQHRSQGDWVSILSFWNVYYTDEQGATPTIQASLVYPEPDEDSQFGGEGTGVHRIVQYPWQEGRWYRMQLRCSTSDAGTTLVDQWICDPETETWTQLCCYDTNIPGATLAAPGFFFLENYDPSTCGEVRTMEVANIQVTPIEDETSYIDVQSAWLSPNGGEPAYSGSYAYGSQGNRFWAITSGVGGDWYGNGHGQTGGWYSVQ